MRLVNAVLAVLLSLVLVVLAVVVPVEVVFAFLGRDPWVLPWPGVAETLRGTTWEGGGTRTILVLVVVVGLVLLLAQLARRRPGELVLAPLSDGVRSGTTRRSLERALSHAAGEVSGVAGASVSARRRRVSVKASSRLHETDPLRGPVTEAVQARLDALGLAQPPRLRVSIRRES